MAKNVERIARLAAAAQQLVEIETRYAEAKEAESRGVRGAAKEGSRGHGPAKTELQRAFIEYLEYHIWPSLREPGLEGFPYHRGPQV